MIFNRRTFLKNATFSALAGASQGSVALTKPAKSFDFDIPLDRRNTNCIKWDRQRHKFGDDKFSYGLGIATMDFRTAPCITNALAVRSKNEAWGYIDNFDRLTRGIVRWNKERQGLIVNPSTIEISAGVYPGIIAALRTLSPPGSKVLLMTPTYSGFYYHIEHTRTIPVDSPLIYRDGRYEIDWADLESRMTADTHTMILCNPQNPTGNVWSKSDLLRIGHLCLKHQVTVLADEIHSDIIREGYKFTPFASLPDQAVVDNSITFNAISKTFNMAGMKTAYFHSTNVALLESVKANHRGDLSILGVVANEAAYEKGGEWLDQLLPYLEDNHQFVAKYFERNIPLINCKHTEGTYLIWLDVKKLLVATGAESLAVKKGISPEYFLQNWLVENTGVFLNSGSKYGTGGAGHMRMNIASPRAVLKNALDSLAKRLDQI